MIDIKFDIATKPSATESSFIYLTKQGCTKPLSRQLDKQVDGKLSQLAKQKDKLNLAGTLWSFLADKASVHLCALGGAESGKAGKSGKASRSGKANKSGEPDQPLSSLEFNRLLTKQAPFFKSFAEPKLQIFIDELSVATTDDEQLLKQLGLAIAEALYRFDYYKSKPSSHKTTSYRIKFVTDRKLANSKQLCRELEAVVAGVFWAKDLANMPPNECTPTYLAKQAKQLAKGSKALSCKVLGEKELNRLGMNAYLAVARGSHQPPQFILLEYKGGGRNQAPLVLLGKGMTFDTGGISLKPAAAMDEMKYDMCGAASVLGTMKAISRLAPKINVIGAVAAAENMPDANAYRPGDIIKTSSGISVEVLNTDAEGRMVLCDALTYVTKYKPRYVLDIATLTGACVVALGHRRAGFFANNEELADRVEQATETYQDLVWRLPMDEEYMEDMKSNFADIAHIGNRSAGTITAACFLSKFAKDYAWGHLDIAGTAWHSGARKGATGRPVPLLTQFVLNSLK